MTPDDNSDINDPQTPARSDRSIPSLSRSSHPLSDTIDSQRQAAADLTRGQISQIYERDSPYKEYESEETSANPYERTHSPESELSTTEHFQRYHTAWQDYYQKYYENYYTQAVRQTQQQLRLKADMEKHAKPAAVYGAEQKKTEPDTPRSATKKLQSEFKERVRSRASRVRRSKHFWPLITAATVAVVFLFLQYNRLLVANVAAYVSPGSVDPQNIIVDPTSDTKVGPESKLVIPKINVDAPVDYSVTTFDNDQIEAHLKNGVVKYAIPGANANPNQVGNLVIGGHSSNDVFDDGNYKFVFVQLEKIVVGDTFYINYQGTRYTYHVTKTQTIEPNDIAALTQPVSKPTVTLITCTPVGTALHRFIVFGEQVSPDPSAATPSSDPVEGNGTSTIPGNSPTLFQRILGN